MSILGEDKTALYEKYRTNLLLYCGRVFTGGSAEFFRKLRIMRYKIHWSADFFFRKIRIVANFSYRTKQILFRKIKRTTAKSALIETALGEYSLY